MKLFDVKKIKEFSEEKMKKVKLFDTENLFCDLYCLKPAQFQKIHTHQGADKVYFVLEGVGNFYIGDGQRRLKNGTALLAPAGVMHGVVNDSTSELIILVFMAPNPNRND